MTKIIVEEENYRDNKIDVDVDVDVVVGSGDREFRSLSRPRSRGFGFRLGGRGGGRLIRGSITSG